MGERGKCRNGVMKLEGDSGAPRRLSIVLHAQHLSGVGHYVRTYEIARALSDFHEVNLIEGGRAVPRGGGGASIERIALPPVARDATGLVELGGGAGIDEVLRERARLLCDHLTLILPDVLLVEHFPFSKWELAAEILAGIETLRRANPRARVLCSLRDIAPQTRHERVPADEYRSRVLAQLGEHFDAVLVHGDPRLAGPEDHFPELARSSIPIHYTGIVSEKLVTAVGGEAAPGGIASHRPFVLVSVGGGAGDARFVDLCIEAWRQLRRNRAMGGHRLLLFAGLGWDAERVTVLERRAAGEGVQLRSFAPDFLQWLAAADLAVTHAGYNTCANILETGVRAVLVPDPQMSDQALRAAKLAETGIVETLLPDALSAESLAAAMRRALDRPKSRHGLNLDGAAETRRIIESLATAS